MVVCAGERGEGGEVDGLGCTVQLKQTGPAKEIYIHVVLKIQNVKQVV